MTWNDIGMKLIDALLPLLVMLITLALGALCNWLRLQAGKLKTDMARESLLAAIGQAERVGVDAVSATNQVLVDGIKARSADGSLSKDEARAAMEEAVAYFKAHIGPWALSVLEAAYGPVEKWLKSFLEAKVAQSKWGGEAYDIIVPPSLPASEPATGPMA